MGRSLKRFWLEVCRNRTHGQMDCRSVCHLRCASKALPEALREALRHHFIDTGDRAKACGLSVSWEEGDRCRATVGLGRCRKTVSRETFLTQYCSKHQCGRSLAQPGDRKLEVALAGQAPGEGDEYEGERDAQSLYHGQGTLRMPDGAVYCGSFCRGRFHGMGRLERRSGQWWTGITMTYVGQCFLGMAQGRGQMKVRIVYARDEYCYTGEFVDGVPQGHGVWRWLDNDHLRMSYEGVVKSPRHFGGILARAPLGEPFQKYLLDMPMNSINGIGVATGPDRNMQGQWQNGYMYGHGVAVVTEAINDERECTARLEGQWRRIPPPPRSQYWVQYRHHGWTCDNFNFGRCLRGGGTRAGELCRGSFRYHRWELELHGLGDRTCGGSYSSGRFEDGRLVSRA